MIPTGPNLTKLATTDVNTNRIPADDNRLLTAVYVVSSSYVSRLIR